MDRRLVLACCVALVSLGCAHVPLSGADLDQIKKPAILSRVAPGAGPKAKVFSQDDSYAATLAKSASKKTPAEFDAILADRLLNGYKNEKKGKAAIDIPSITRFEISDTLRAQTLEDLPKEFPWTRTASPAEVSSVLESLLVEEVSAPEPDYSRLLPLGIDWVLEIVVEEYGMRSEKGRAGVYLVGNARLFKIGGGEAYHRRFFSDDVRAGIEHLDPFLTAKDPTLFRDRMRQMLESIAAQLAKDMVPEDRRPR